MRRIAICLAVASRHGRLLHVPTLALIVPLAITACGGVRVIENAPAAPQGESAVPAPPAVVASHKPVIVDGPLAIVSRHVALTVPGFPDYAGAWAGRSMRVHCVESGGAVGVACRSLPTGQVLELALTQRESNVRGILTLGTVQAEVVGSVRPDGTLALRGEHVDSTHTLTLRGWRSIRQGSQMHGTFSYLVAPEDERLGTVRVTAAVEARPADAEGQLDKN